LDDVCFFLLSFLLSAGETTTTKDHVVVKPNEWWANPRLKARMQKKHSIHTSPVPVPGRPAKPITPNKSMMMIERHRQSLSLAALVLACFLWEISLSCQLCIINGSQATTFPAARLLFGQESQLQRTTAYFLDIASNTHPDPGRKLTLARHLGPMVTADISSPQAKMSPTTAVPSRKTQRLLQNYAMMVPKRKRDTAPGVVRLLLLLEAGASSAADDTVGPIGGDESDDRKKAADPPTGGDGPSSVEDHGVDKSDSPASSAASNDAASTAMLASINFYKQVISPLLPPACRFVPTCSSYGVQAIREMGPVKGFILIAWRLLRCSPIGGKGYDPPRYVPRALNRIMYQRYLEERPSSSLLSSHPFSRGQVATSLLYVQQLLTARKQCSLYNKQINNKQQQPP
jgi:uncharacterized protein